MEERKYFIAIDNQQFGPYAAAEITARSLAPSTLVWYAGLSEWKRLDSCSEIFATSLESVPPPLPAIPITNSSLNNSGSILSPYSTQVIAFLLIVAASFLSRTAPWVIRNSDYALIEAKIKAGNILSTNDLNQQTGAIEHDFEILYIVLGFTFPVLISYAFHAISRTKLQWNTFILTVLSYSILRIWKFSLSIEPFGAFVAIDLILIVGNCYLWSLCVKTLDATTKATFIVGWSVALLTYLLGSLDNNHIVQSLSLAIIGSVTTYYTFSARNAEWQWITPKWLL